MPINFEIWIKIQCPNKECRCGQKRNWFSMPSADLPDVIKCNLCGNTITLEEFTERKMEYSRRVKPIGDILDV